MESPVIVGKRADFSAPPVNVNETGFPFDDSDYDSSDHFQTRLNDLAQRHPELASHLRFDDFPSLRRKRYGSGSSSGAADNTDPQQPEPTRPGASTSSRFADHSFPSGFNRFPFTSSFEEEFAGEPRREDKPPEVPKQYHSQEKRGRKPNPFLPQHLSNTVDLGQKQPPVEETRSQRSMSAPPSENRTTPRAQSRSNEPFQQQPQQQSDMGNTLGRRQSPNKPQEHETRPPRQERTPPRQGPQERFIPILVEGRDELLHPKKDIHHSGSGDKVFGSEKVNMGMPFSSQRQQEHHPQQPQPRYEQHIPKQAPPSQQKPRQQAQPQAQWSHTQPPPGQSQSTHAQPQEQAREQPTPPPTSNDPIAKITRIRNDVTDLMNKVEAFQGTRKDREFIYLDEMLTRNLIKLDNIETEGKENIRNARKEAIKCIQDCLNRLEKQGQAKEQELKAAELQMVESNPSSDVIEAEQQHAADTKELRKSSITINVNAYANVDGGLIEPVATDSNEAVVEKMDTASILTAIPIPSDETSNEPMETHNTATSEVPPKEPENTSQPADSTAQK